MQQLTEKLQLLFNEISKKHHVYKATLDDACQAKSRLSEQNNQLTSERQAFLAALKRLTDQVHSALFY